MRKEWTYANEIEQSYCSSAYPQAVLTSFVDTTITNVVTTSGPASTVISNVTIPFETIVETVQTFTTTTSYVPTLLTTTDTFTLITETDTVTTTVPATIRKRQVSPTDAASVFSSVLSRPSSDIEFACSCLQTPPTTLVTVTQTALSTTIITPVVSNNLTITSVIPITATETDTAIVVATTTLETTTTTTTTAVATSTDVYCGAYGFVALNTSLSGRVLSGTSMSVGFDNDLSQAALFNIESDSTFNMVRTTNYLTSDRGSVKVRDKQLWGRRFTGVYCTTTQMSGLQNNAVATVKCKPDNLDNIEAYAFFTNGGSIFILPLGYNDDYLIPISMGLICGQY